MRVKMIITLLLILALATPSYAVIDKNPVKKIIKKVLSFFRESPFAKQRRQIQKAYDDDKISKNEYEDRMADVDRQEEDYREMQQRAMEQRRQASEQQAVN